MRRKYDCSLHYKINHQLLRQSSLQFCVSLFGVFPSLLFSKIMSFKSKEKQQYSTIIFAGLAISDCYLLITCIAALFWSINYSRLEFASNKCCSRNANVKLSKVLISFFWFLRPGQNRVIQQYEAANKWVFLMNPPAWAARNCWNTPYWNSNAECRTEELQEYLNSSNMVLVSTECFYFNFSMIKWTLILDLFRESRRWHKCFSTFYFIYFPFLENPL